MDKPQLYGTPLSHFTRKLRILMLELKVPFDFIRTPNLLEDTASTYGDNPLMRIPTLIHNGTVVIESDHIARHLVAAYDPADRFAVCAQSAAALNQLAVANGIMSHEVTLILARRGGLEALDSVAYFRKIKRSIASGLAWLERELAAEEGRFTYAEIATVCMWQHLVHYQLLPELHYPRLDAHVARFAAREAVQQTTPAASLAAYS